MAKAKAKKTQTWLVLERAGATVFCPQSQEDNFSQLEMNQIYSCAAVDQVDCMAQYAQWATSKESKNRTLLINSEVVLKAENIGVPDEFKLIIRVIDDEEEWQDHDINPDDAQKLLTALDSILECHKRAEED